MYEWECSFFNHTLLLYYIYFFFCVCGKFACFCCVSIPYLATFFVEMIMITGLINFRTRCFPVFCFILSLAVI